MNKLCTVLIRIAAECVLDPDFLHKNIQTMLIVLKKLQMNAIWNVI